MALPRRDRSVLPPRLGAGVGPERWAEARPRDFPDYLVSTRGRVWNARRGRLLTAHASPDARSPYPKVRLSDGTYSSGPRRGERKHRTFYVHRLVALAFVPGRTAARWQVHHVDGDTYNAAAENLRWATPLEHRALHGPAGSGGDSAPLDLDAFRAELAAAYGDQAEAPF